MMLRKQTAPLRWKLTCANSECSLHQLSPYIGKIKSSIAGELIERYTKKGDLVVDPFSGAGTIPLEAKLRGRQAFGADISPYARVLSQAKLFPPPTQNAAIQAAKRALNKAALLPKPDLRSVPQWVKRFFHPETLHEVIQFAEVGRLTGNEYLMACFLGILHHQRPGFLSYPSSHLVPYLRDRKFPPSEFPEMYTYRELKPRLLAKIQRSYKRFNQPPSSGSKFQQSSVQQLKFPKIFDALITSPPYMNALDYGRDNRLRLWFIDPNMKDAVDNKVTQCRKAFLDAMISLAKRIESNLRPQGHCIIIVGEKLKRNVKAHPSEVIVDIIKEQAPSLSLRKIITDDIPDVRRSRRECRGVKTEHFLIFRKN